MPIPSPYPYLERSHSNFWKPKIKWKLLNRVTEKLTLYVRRCEGVTCSRILAGNLASWRCDCLGYVCITGRMHDRRNGRKERLVLESSFSASWQGSQGGQLNERWRESWRGCAHHCGPGSRQHRRNQGSLLVTCFWLQDAISYLKVPQPSKIAPPPGGWSLKAWTCQRHLRSNHISEWQF